MGNYVRDHWPSTPFGPHKRGIYPAEGILIFFTLYCVTMRLASLTEYMLAGYLIILMLTLVFVGAGVKILEIKDRGLKRKL